MHSPCPTNDWIIVKKAVHLVQVLFLVVIINDIVVEVKYLQVGGATERIFTIVQAFINEGDEVDLLGPSFDIYSAQVQMAGGCSPAARSIAQL